MDEQDKRIAKIIGKFELSLSKGVPIYYDYLKKNLKLPCEVTGGETFLWEEPFVLRFEMRKYTLLKKKRPSSQDIYDILEIDINKSSKWMFLPDDDIGAYIKRKSDGKFFYIGLSELKTTDNNSENYKILNDYAYWVYDRFSNADF